VGQEPLLTIIVPTFNRRDYLAKLLAQLEKEIRGLEGLVSIIISDNHSTDGTALEIERYIGKNSSWQVINHQSNIGADRNFLSAIERSASRYFWIIGDDDLPRSGLIRLIIKYLQSERPTLLYLCSQWSSVVEVGDLPPVQTISPFSMAPIDYAEKINIFSTFISAWIVDAFALKELGIGGQELSKGIGSSFIQLGWILPLIRDSSILAAIDEPAILATGGNTGGYQLIKTFAVNYPAFVRRMFPVQKEMQNALLAPFVKEYLPNLIRSARSGQFSRMSKENNALANAIMSLGLYKEFWTHTFPAFVLPMNTQPPKSLFHHSLPKRIGRKIKRELRQIAMPAYTIAVNKLSAQVIAKIEVNNAEHKKRKTEAEN
jgi:glycosyltransferase involved in cell wall biosynthesis